MGSNNRKKYERARKGVTGVLVNLSMARHLGHITDDKKEDELVKNQLKSVVQRQGMIYVQYALPAVIHSAQKTKSFEVAIKERGNKPEKVYLVWEPLQRYFDLMQQGAR